MEEIERQLVELVRAGEFQRATTAAMRAYGAEVYGFLINVMGGEPDAAEVFSQAAEDLWRGMPGFRASCSIRTWFYLLARHAAARFRRSPWNRGSRSREEHIDQMAAQVRSNTSPWQRTDVKDKWRALRDALEPDDRELLVLRIDREMSWNDVARVMLGGDGRADADLAREAARLRKRFQLLKDELRERARKAGLVDDP